MTLKEDLYFLRFVPIGKQISPKRSILRWIITEKIIVIYLESAGKGNVPVNAL